MGSPSIITGAGASCILLKKELNIVGSSIDIWKTEWTKHINSRRQRINNSVLGWEIIL